MKLTSAEIKQKLQTIDALTEELNQAAPQSPNRTEPCPLGDGDTHNFNSKIIFGRGAWEWTCKFCGETEIE